MKAGENVLSNMIINTGYVVYLKFALGFSGGGGEWEGRQSFTRRAETEVK